MTDFKQLLTAFERFAYGQSLHSASKQFAKGVVNKLFPKSVEYGDIQSHFNTERLNSFNFTGFKELVIGTHYIRKKLTSELHHFSNELRAKSQNLDNRKSSLFKFLYKKKIAKETELVEQLSNQVNSLKESQLGSSVDLKYQYENSLLTDAYSDLTSSFTTMKSANKIWDVTTAQMNLDTKAAAGTSIDRHEVKFDFKGLDILSTNEKVLHVENFNGGDFYFYPMFIIYFKGREEIAIIDYTDLYIEYKEQQFLERKEDIVSDVTTIGETWYRVNKDGSPDRRFVGNYKIPIALYGSIHLKSPSGINELYYISDHKKAKHFYEQYSNYQAHVRNSTYEMITHSNTLLDGGHTGNG
ncbi:hypothetical protein MTO98_26395 [Mucilaginibacter sp. SMC90]|uniref:hypothetical protein n=1 Tax=Mucilaginibacter sp. SMC90 TaxID=2929803 RepID=UPI001FB2A88E|nr:hypothetical protein [Mucilaginibacter sp. SMC90]UOE47945.1 hypothetical protein MTO98_26395 [Mucilaginibacter sp. SMC90]